MSSRSRAKRHARRRRERLLGIGCSRKVEALPATPRDSFPPVPKKDGGMNASSVVGKDAALEMNAERRRHGRGVRWGRTFLVAVSSLLLVWVLLALFLPRTVLRTLLEEQLADVLNAPVTLEQIRINPLTFQLSISGIRIARGLSGPMRADHPTETASGRDAEPVDTEAHEANADFLHIDHLVVRPEFGALFHPIPILASVEVTGLRLDIAYLGGGRFSFSDLLAGEDGDDDFIASLFSVRDLKVSGGTLVFRDEPLGLVHVVHDIDLYVPFGPVAAGSAERVPRLDAEVGGTRVSLTGVRQKEGEGVQFAIRTTPLHMEYFRRYLAAFTPVRLNSGEIMLDLLLGFAQPRPGRVETVLSGTVYAEDVEVASPEGEVVGRLKRGEAELERFTLDERLIRLSRMEVDGLYLKAKRDKSGKVDWESWMSSALSAHAATDSEETVRDERVDGAADMDRSGNSEEPVGDTSFVVEGADLILRNSNFSWKDETIAGSREIEITGVDGRIAEYSTRAGERTSMRLSFGINSEGVLALDGEGTLNPPCLNADLMIQDLPLLIARPFLAQTPFADVSGHLNLKGPVRLATGGTAVDRDDAAATVSVVMGRTEADVRELAFACGRDGTPAVRIGSCSCKGLELDTEARTFVMSSMSIVNPSVRVLVDAGKVSLAARFPAAGNSSGQKGKEGASLPEGAFAELLPTSAASFLESWKLNLDQLSLTGGRIDRVLTGGKTETLFSGLSLKTGQVTQQLDRPVTFQLHSGGTGSLDIRGSLRPIPLKGTLSLNASEYALGTLNLFMRPLTDLMLEGKLQASLELDLDERAKTIHVQAAGDLTIRDIVLRDAATGHLFGGIRRLTAESLRWQSDASFFDVSSILIDKARLGLVLSEAGKLDLWSSLMKSGASEARTVSGKKQDNPGEGTSLSIGKIRMQDGTIAFRDRRRTPELTLFLRSANATISDVYRNRDGKSSPASVQLAGQLDGAPLTLVGQADLLGVSPSASLTLQLSGANLASYSSYFNEFLGYPVEQGILDLKTRLSLADNAFRLDNSISVKKLVLGPKDTRPDAPDYPVTLGLALLEDMRGNLELDLPITGRLDDPRLEIDGLVGRALGGLFAKAITSPFALVGSFFSLFMPDDPELRFISFRPGQTVLSREARSRLDEIAELLAARPKLKLELTGLYEPFGDSEGLRREQLLRRLGRLSPARKASELRFSPEEYERRLRKLYAGFFAATGREEADVMEQRLLSRESVEEEALEELARRRAESVRRYLLSKNPALDSRVALSKSGNAVRSGSAHVELNLR